MKIDKQNIQNKEFLLFYWYACVFIILATPFIIKCMGNCLIHMNIPKATLAIANIMFISQRVIWLLLSISASFVIISKMDGKIILSKYLLLAVCLVILMLCTPLFIITNSEKEIGSLLSMSFFRSLGLILSILFFIYLSDFIFYFEKIFKSSKNNYVHKRYLGYFNTFIWAFVFGGLQFSLIYFNVVKEGGKSIIEPIYYSRSLWLMQLSFIALFGIILLVCSFHFKLKQIENNIKNAY